MLEVWSNTTMPSHKADVLHCDSYSNPRSLRLDSGTERDSAEATDHSSTPRSRTPRRTRDGAQSAPSHFSAQVCQNLTERLLDNSEMSSLEDALVFESSVFDDWSEAASGWRGVVPYPKYVAHPPPVRHKSDSLMKKGGGGVRPTVRCVDEDFDSEQFCPSWKGNVEPVTYRYVPNNGYYRNHKPVRDVREWPMMKRIKSEKGLRLAPEMRQAQKTLKRDLENHFRNAVKDFASGDQEPGAMQPVGDQCADTAIKLQQAAEERERASKMVHITKRLPMRKQQLIKSTSDLFMENFNSRLNALKKEIQTPNVPATNKKPPEGTGVPNHSPMQLTKKLKEVHVPDTAHPTTQSTKQHADKFGEDLFTVIPMCKPEVPLRPLEKLTPKQKQMEKHSSTTNSSRDGSPSPSLPLSEDPDDDLMIMLACATTQPPSPPKDTASSGINTVRSAIAMTNFDIEKMRNIPLRSKVGDKAKPFFVQKDGAGSTGTRGTMRYTVAGSSTDQPSANQGRSDRKDILAHMDRQVDNKLDSVGSALPEIMGKRLSVITTVHRLL